MVKDKRARAQIRETMVAWVNLVGSIVETMKKGGMSNDLIHHFLDTLDNSNELLLRGETRRFACDILEVMRMRVADND